MVLVPKHMLMMSFSGYYAAGTLAFTPTAPSSFAATPIADGFSLTWNDTNQGRTTYQIQVSSDNSTWSDLTTTALGATSYNYMGVGYEEARYFRNRAVYNDVLTSWVESGLATTAHGAITGDGTNDIIVNGTADSLNLGNSSNYTLTLTSIIGTFSPGETITGGTSGATATVVSVSGTTMAATATSSVIRYNEAITGGSSGATATITKLRTDGDFTIITIAKGSVLNDAGILTAPVSGNTHADFNIKTGTTGIGSVVGDVSMDSGKRMVWSQSGSLPINNQLSNTGFAVFQSKISHRETNCLTWVDYVINTPLLTEYEALQGQQTGGGSLLSYPSEDITLNNIYLLCRRNSDGYTDKYNKIKNDSIIILKGVPTSSQRSWIANADITNGAKGRIWSELASAAARAEGIGVSGVDTIGSGGITCLIVRCWTFAKLYKSDGTAYGFNTKQSGVTAYVHERVTDNKIYGTVTNWADGETIIAEY